MTVTDKIGTAAARSMLFAAAVAIMPVLWSCGGRTDTEGALFVCDEYTVYPDSFVSASLTLAVRGDTVVKMSGDDVSIEIGAGHDAGGLLMEGSDGLISTLFNSVPPMEAGVYDRFTPYEIYIADGLTDVETASATVDSRIAGGEVVEIASGQYRWPVAMSDAGWGMAAATVSLMTDDAGSARLRATALKRLIDCDLKYVFDRDAGLFAGVPSGMDMCQLPEWSNAADAAVMMTLEGNVARVAGMRYVNDVLPGSYSEDFIDDVAGNIRKRLWIPNLGMLSQTLYQRPYAVAVTAADNLAQGLAVATGCAGDAMSRRIVSNTPMNENGVQLTYPDQGLSHDGRREALTASMWAIASARAGNSEAWALSYGNLVALSVSDGYAARLLQGVTLRTVFGIEPCVDGLRVRPFVHEALGDYRKISGLRYRNSELTVTVRGRGDVVSTFSIDGEVTAEAKVPADIKGKHDIEVVLSGSGNASGGVNTAQSGAMPQAPEVKTEGARTFTVSSQESGQFIVYLNGAVSELIERNHYELYNAAPVTSVSFETDVSNEYTGYASKNYMYIPEKDSVSILCSRVAPTGGRVLAKKELSSKYVESTRYKNARISFEYGSPTGGSYYIRLRYLDGLGVVNKNRQYALRILNVNGDMAGIMVLPQRGPEKWSVAEDWASMHGRTEPIAVELDRGRNVISIDYFAPEGIAGFDHDSNTVIPVALELIRKS